MSKQLPTPARKRRTREHVLADLSINHLERSILLCGFSAERVQHDYGYDLTMTTYSVHGEIEPGIAYFQVKATDDLPMLADNRTVSWAVQRRDLRLWLAEAYPVWLIVYDGRRERASWLDLQRYAATRSAAELFRDGATVQVHIPIENRLDAGAIQALARRKNRVHQQLRGEGRPHA